MARTLEEMVSKGTAKLRAKLSTMASNWEAAKSRMISNYEAQPFGPRTKEAYRAGISAAKYRAPDVDKWATNWKAAVSR